jgi:hypothetical protein
MRWSLEGWNFDKLENNRKLLWNKINNSNLYVSDLFNYNQLHLQLLKSNDRVVGMIDRYPHESPIIIKLGTWGNKVNKEIIDFAERENYPLICVGVLSNHSIDNLQEGLS